VGSLAGESSEIEEAEALIGSMAPVSDLSNHGKEDDRDLRRK
jgi:hypothetical protein